MTIEKLKKGGRIEVMPEDLASQIAAGEVVERPASVIKELIENALDASASSIEVDISLSRRRMRIKDDGYGIPPGQLKTALARHGTSKVYRRDDIFGIGTFGFRGEALPSIASVSRLTLTSHAEGEPEGSQIIVEGGEIKSVEAAPPIGGTELLVENLFYNTPARRKFARSDSTEMTHITSAVINSALSFPQKRFSFVKDKKQVLRLSPAKTLRERVGQIFGIEYAEKLIEINFREGEMLVFGLAGTPDFNRATSIDQYFFVNERPVKDTLIRMSTARAYFDLLPRGRKPVVFLKLSLPLESVDVNVHPAKTEVRFSEPGRISTAIVEAIRKGLGSSAVPVMAQTRKSFNNSDDQNVRISSSHLTSITGRPSAKGGFERSFELWSKPLREDGLLGANEPPLSSPAHGRLSPTAIPIGQIFKTFLLIEDGDSFFILDQHTVHERILFERFMAKLSGRQIERQKLLVTETIDTDSIKASLILSNLKTFDELGWTLEPFGKSSFVIREVPALLVGKNYTEAVKELSETIEGNRELDFKEMVSELVSRMACRAAVKAGDSLSLKEISALVEDLGKTELPYTCPHGRPVAVEISRDSLYKDFLRPS